VASKASTTVIQLTTTVIQLTTSFENVLLVAQESVGTEKNDLENVLRMTTFNTCSPSIKVERKFEFE